MPLSHRCNEQTNLLELQIPTKRRSVCTKDFNKLFVEVDEQWLNPPFKQFARWICPNKSILTAMWQLKGHSRMTINIQKEL